MRLILGIGNPGKRYSNNRHNVGFMFLDYLAEKYSISFIPSQHDYYYYEHNLSGNLFSLIKPSNYVNNSGYSALQALSHYKALIDDLLVVYDDVHLPFADIRVRLVGGDGGHNGLHSIIYHLSSENFSRIRIGVGNKEFSQENLVDFVLSDFFDDERESLPGIFERCKTLTEAFIMGGTKNLLDINSILTNPNREPEK